MSDLLQKNCSNWSGSSSPVQFYFAIGNRDIDRCLALLKHHFQHFCIESWIRVVWGSGPFLVKRTIILCRFCKALYFFIICSELMGDPYQYPLNIYPAVDGRSSAIYGRFITVRDLHQVYPSHREAYKESTQDESCSSGSRSEQAQCEAWSRASGCGGELPMRKGATSACDLLVRLCPKHVIIASASGDILRDQYHGFSRCLLGWTKQRKLHTFLLPESCHFRVSTTLVKRGHFKAWCPSHRFHILFASPGTFTCKLNLGASSCPFVCHYMHQ